MQGTVNGLLQFFRLRTEYIGAGHQHLLTHTDEQIGVGAQQGIHQIKMLYDDPLAMVKGVNNGISQNTHLGKAVFKPNIQMVGMGGEKGSLVADIQNRQGTDIHAVIIVGQFQAGEHTPNQRAFAGTGFTDHTDELVAGGEILLGQLHTQLVHTPMTSGGIVAADDMRSAFFEHNKTSL